VVPEVGNPQALNRYSYVTNNPLRYTDPSGHVFDPYEGGGFREHEQPAPIWQEAVDEVASLLGIGIGDTAKIADVTVALDTWFAKGNLSYEATVTGSAPDKVLTIANTYQKIGPWRQTAEGDLRVQTLPVQSGSEKARSSGVLEFGISEHPSFASLKFSVGAEMTCEAQGSRVNPGLEQVLTVSIEIRPKRAAIVVVAIAATGVAILRPDTIPGILELGRRALLPNPAD